MALILVRYAELGLKSEKVRRRFLSNLLRDVEASLMRERVEHLIESERGRIFVETGEPEKASKVLASIPGIFSFSQVEQAPSDWDGLMKALSDYGKGRLKEGMSYGLKVRRVGTHPYTSHQVAAEGGGAVMSHLREGDVKVDLKDPDIWFEVEIRHDKAYLFTTRTRAIGGLPYGSQGAVVLYLPRLPADISRREDLSLRASVSYLLMKRRGCRVLPVTERGALEGWQGMMSGLGPLKIEEIESLEGGPSKALSNLMKERGASGLVLPLPLEMSKEAPLLHDSGLPVATFFPTVLMDAEEMRLWLKRLV